MSQGLAMKCDIDVDQVDTTDVLKKIVDEVFKDQGITISLKKQKYHARAYIQGYKESFGYGITIELPSSLASQKGLQFAPRTREGKVAICLGKEITQEEYQNPKFEGQVASSDEFKKRSNAMIADNHDWNITHPDGVRANPELGKKRDEFRDKLAKCAQIAGAAGTVLKGIRKLEEGGKIAENGVEAIKDDLAKQGVELAKKGAGVIRLKVRTPPKTEPSGQSVMPEMQTKIKPQAPQQAKPLGLMR